jgi:hypothetical protein
VTPRSHRIAGALFGAQAGAALGLVLLGGTLLLPLAATLAGTLVGPLAVDLTGRARCALAERWIRSQLRRAAADRASSPST